MLECTKGTRMNSGPLIFLGLFSAMACSWLSFVMGPQLQLGDLRPTTNIVVGALGQVYPHAQPGAVHQGAEIYRANGCASCHTQQVRPRDLGSDLNRGWGVRRSTAYDYLYESPVLPGSQRVGPDLANAGTRMDAAAVLLRLYEPRAILHDSIMPSYQYLFDKHEIRGFPSPDALQVPAPYGPPAGYEVVPRPEALALAAYVAGLHQDGYLYEAPPPPGLAGKTNAPAAPTTNSPAK
jgi:cytochrome c oxidase cbb3-type subunit 2